MLPSPALALRVGNPVEAGLEEDLAKELGHSAGGSTGLTTGLEEGLDPEVRDLLNGWVDPASSTTVRLYRLADQSPELRPDQRAQFVQGLIWYSDRPEIRDLLKKIFLQGDTEARSAVRQMILTGIREDPTGKAVDAFETLFSRLPLEEMEPVFHRVLTEINEGGVLGGALEKIDGLAEPGKQKAKWSPREKVGRSMRTEDRHERLAVAEESPLAIALAQVNRVLFQEIKYGEIGNWKEGWEAQGPALALALEHAFLFEIGRQWAEEHPLSAKLEEFLYKQLRRVAEERVWLSRKTHPAEPLIDGPAIEQGLGFFYKLIAHRLHTRQREENRQIRFPKDEANLARNLFLSLRGRLQTYSTTGDRFLRHRVLERLVELEDDYATYLASLGNLSQKAPQFTETALRGLSELRERFDAKMELKNFRAETRAHLGLLEPSTPAGLEEPLVEGDRVVLNRVADWLKQKLNALRAIDLSLPEVDIVLIHGSAGYLSDDQNRLPVAVLNNHDLVEDLDVAAVLKSPVSSEDSQRFRQLYEDHEEKILDDLKSNLAVSSVVFSGKMDGIVESELLLETLRHDAEYFFQSHQGDVNKYPGSELIRTAWVSRGEWDSKYKPLDVAKRYLELEQLAGDLAFYRHYRDRLTVASDPAAEAAEILQEALKVGRKEALIQKLDGPQALETLALIQKRMGDRLIGLEPTESEQTASWVGEALGFRAPMLEAVRDALMAGKVILWGRAVAGGLVPERIRVTRINENLPKSHSIQKDRTIYMEQGFLPESVRMELARFSAGPVKEIGPDQARAAVSEQKGKKSSDHKSLFVVKEGSELEQALNRELGLADAGWELPIAVVAVPAALVSQISTRALTLYLLDILVQADRISQRRTERLESIRETGTELQLLSTRA